MIKCYATHESPANFAKKNQEVGKNHFREYGNLILSYTGMGEYPRNLDDTTDNMASEAVKKSIISGINLIYTK